jgi:hypothetical protein
VQVLAADSAAHKSDHTDTALQYEHKTDSQVVDKDSFPMLVKNAQMQGSRNPEK